MQHKAAVVTVLCTPDDGCGWHPKHVQWTCRIINRLFRVSSRWTIINVACLVLPPSARRVRSERRVTRRQGESGTIRATTSFSSRIFVESIPLCYILFKADKLIAVSHNKFYQSRQHVLQFRPYWAPSGIKYIIFKTQNKMHVYWICEISKIVQVILNFTYQNISILMFRLWFLFVFCLWRSC